MLRGQAYTQTHLIGELGNPDGQTELCPEPVEGVLHLGQVDGFGSVEVTLAADTVHRGPPGQQLADMLDITRERKESNIKGSVTQCHEIFDVF